MSATHCQLAGAEAPTGISGIEATRRGGLFTFGRSAVHMVAR